MESFGDSSGVLIVDEIGDLKKGSATVGVQRQYTGTAGRIEKAQVAAYLTYAGQRGHALIDRALLFTGVLERGQCPLRCRGIPAEDRVFATKPASWVTGDEVYGAEPRLRAEFSIASGGVCVGRCVLSSDPDGDGIGAYRFVDR